MYAETVTDPNELSHEDLRELAALELQPLRAAKCKYCGKGGLQWLKYGPGYSKWVLVEFDNGRLKRHTCEAASNYFSKHPK